MLLLALVVTLTSKAGAEQPMAAKARLITVMFFNARLMIMN